MNLSNPFLVEPAENSSISYSQLITDLGLVEVTQSGDASTIENVDPIEVLETSNRDRFRSGNYRFLLRLVGGIISRIQEIELNLDTSEVPIQPPDRSVFSFDRKAESLGLHAWRRLILDSSSRIRLETSGSTGQPKVIWHTVSSLARGVRLDENQRDSVWGLAYPLDHLAGLQVLFQAMLNFNPLVQLYGMPIAEIHDAIDQFQITHLSCTPTFLRMLLVEHRVHESLQRLTNGGERYDRDLDNQTRIMFPNAVRRNIYASTEAGPLLVSSDDRFIVPDRLLDTIKIIDGELWLHDSLRVDGLPADQRQTEVLMNTRRNEDDLKLETIESDQLNEKRFWPTGDQVEVVCHQPLTIRFLSRKTEGFNVAGFRVDPTRLESLVRKHPLVANARFYGIPNSLTEHLVGCDLVLKNPNSQPEDDATWDEAEFRSWLVEQVPRHEIPRVVKVVPEIETTDSGKVKRV